MHGVVAASDAEQFHASACASNWETGGIALKEGSPYGILEASDHARVRQKALAIQGAFDANSAHDSRLPGRRAARRAFSAFGAGGAICARGCTCRTELSPWTGAAHSDATLSVLGVVRSSGCWSCGCRGRARAKCGSWSRLRSRAESSTGTACRTVGCTASRSVRCRCGLGCRVRWCKRWHRCWHSSRNDC